MRARAAAKVNASVATFPVRELPRAKSRQMCDDREDQRGNEPEAIERIDLPPFENREEVLLLECVMFSRVLIIATL